MAANNRQHHKRVENAGVSPSRVAAIQVLHRVATDRAFASLALDSEIRRNVDDTRDAALATEIVYGSLRILPELDQAIRRHLTRDLSKMDALVLSALRTATYQIHHLSRVPPYAIVSDTVNFIRHKRGKKLSGFVNAILRKVAEERPQDPTPVGRLCLPSWLESSLKEALDSNQFLSFTQYRKLPLPICLRVNDALIERDQLVQKIQHELPDATVVAGTISPLSILIHKGGNPRAIPGYDQGLFSIQEEGSQLIGLLVDAQKGEQVADVCAGHGTKTTLLSASVGPTGQVIAMDNHEEKLDLIPAELSRLKIEHHKLIREPVDLCVGTAGYGATFDRVLVDAPCTGLGTIHRRPDLLLRTKSTDPGRLSKIQQAIMNKAVQLVRKKGRLIYAVCSPMPQEGLHVARALENKYPNLKRICPKSPWWHLPDNTDHIRRIGPWMSPNSISSPDIYQVIQWIVG